MSTAVLSRHVPISITCMSHAILRALRAEQSRREQSSPELASPTLRASAIPTRPRIRPGRSAVDSVDPPYATNSRAKRATSSRASVSSSEEAVESEE